MNTDQLNAVYRRLEEKCAVLREVMKSWASCSYGWYNGHYFKNAQGIWEREYFPIPVISVDGICDIEIHSEYIDISCKLTREQALSFDMAKLDQYAFEVFGVEEYLRDFGSTGEDTEQIRACIRESNESEIGFSFRFGWELTEDQVCEFAKFLKEKGFYY